MSQKLIKLGKDFYVTEDVAESETKEFLLNLSLPDIYYDAEYEKWAIFFTDADSGGYDAAHFTFYFDNLETLLWNLGISLRIDYVEEVSKAERNKQNEN